MSQKARRPDRYYPASIVMTPITPMDFSILQILRDPSNTDDSGPAYRKYDMESIRNTGLLLRGACELHRLEQSDLEPESSKHS